MAEFLYHGANSDPHTGQQSLALFCREPIPDSDSNPPHSLDSSNSGGEFRTEQTGISCLKSHPSDGRQPEVDGRRCVQLLFQKDSVAQYHGAVEGQARLGAVPPDEVGDGSVKARPLWTARGREGRGLASATASYAVARENARNSALRR